MTRCDCERQMKVRVSKGKVRETVELGEKSENERRRYFRVRVMIYIYI